jgi:pimeloyl-ACP methyl ester carboxylesterase
VQHAPTRLFLPGFAARARSYGEGLPAGWEALQPPAVAVSGGSLTMLVDWLAREVARRPAPALLAGHSMGAALAILLAARDPSTVAGLTLIAPAGLPLTKPVRASAADFIRQLAAGRHDLGQACASAAELLRSPQATIRLIHVLRHLDLRHQMSRVRQAGTPVTVVGCDTDTLVTRVHCQRAARFLGGSYREVRLDGGHVWMFGRWPTLATVLAETPGASHPALFA